MPAHAGVRGNKRADSLAGNTAVDGTVMISQFNQESCGFVTLQNEEGARCDNVYIYIHKIIYTHTIVDMGVTRGKGVKPLIWKDVKIIQSLGP